LTNLETRRLDSTVRKLGFAVLACATLAIVGFYVDGALWLHWLTKPGTTLLIVMLVWRQPSVDPAYRRWLLVGLLFSTLGDILLMPPGDRFVFGLGSFLFAHLAYLAALRRRAALFAAAWPFLAYAVLCALVLSQLWPSLPPPMRVPVLLYIAALAGMAAQAAAVWWQRRDRASALAALGAALFVFSDSLIAWDRFVAAFAYAKLLILVSYWSAQWLLARSAADPRG